MLRPGMFCFTRCSRAIAVALLFAASFFACSTCWAAKNVILMISDGAGYNTWRSASMFQGKLGCQVYEQPGWLHYSCSTFPLNQSNKPTGDLQQAPKLIYDPEKAWQGDLKESYAYLTGACTDSAAAATALATGQKTYNNSINWSNEDRPMKGKTIAEIAHAEGKSTGVITSVTWNHATPSGLGGAHNISRSHAEEIAREMLDSDWLDVIMGAGHPDFDSTGRPITDNDKKKYSNVGGQTIWEEIKQGKRPWKLIETKEEFEALAEGPTPKKVLGTAQVAGTLQASRETKDTKVPYDKVNDELSRDRFDRLPYTVPLNATVPSLATMAKAALNCLDDSPNGFYLMIEGGAVDWANHANKPDHMIEEQIDFNAAVEAVVQWIESHGGWDETLLILTADHETGLIWGPDSDNIPFQPIEDRGPGKLPRIKYNSHGHSNSLVPLYARGPGSDRFKTLVKGKDAKAAEYWGTPDYVDNTDVFKVMHEEVKSNLPPTQSN